MYPPLGSLSKSHEMRLVGFTKEEPERRRCSKDLANTGVMEAHLLRCP